jgi:hypothetical protein
VLVFYFALQGSYQLVAQCSEKFWDGVEEASRRSQVSVPVNYISHWSYKFALRVNASANVLKRVAGHVGLPKSNFRW